MKENRKGWQQTDQAKDIYLRGLTNLSVTDGREVLYTGDLAAYFSESALHQNRAYVEIQNLIALSKSGLSGFPVLLPEETKKLDRVWMKFDPSIVAQYDRFGYKGKGPFEHDVKSVEVHLRDLFEQEGLGHLVELIHFPFTSEDVNNLAYNRMLRNGINHEWLPKVLELCGKLAKFSIEYADVPVLSKTHGMNASPTTFGKRFAYFLSNLMSVLKGMEDLRLSGKYSGAVGNDSATAFVAPDFDFAAYAKEFVESLGFRYKACENQRNSHIEVVELLNKINLVNLIAIDLCENIRLNVTMGWLEQIANESNVGSSVMPHKINPWFFENAGGILEQSVAMINAAGAGLIPSSFERDLSDHPWERAYGEMIGKSLIGLAYISQGLDSLRINDAKALEELNVTPEILTEAVQIAGRLAGKKDIYMKIKMLARGRNIDLALLHAIIDENISDPVMAQRLKALKPEDYVGKAPEIARAVHAEYVECEKAWKHGFLHELSGLSAILCDLDSTLQFGDKLELHARFTDILSNLGMEFSSEEIDQFIDRSDYKEMRKLVVDAHNAKDKSLISEEEFEAENKRVSGNHDHHFYLGEKVRENLEMAKEKGYLVALVSTRGSNSMPRLLNVVHKIGDLFDVVVNRDDCKKRKPHPHPIALALEKLGVKGSRAMYVGDKQEDDIIAGNALKMKTVLITEQSLDPYGATPDFVFRKPGDLWGMLNQAT